MPEMMKRDFVASRHRPSVRVETIRQLSSLLTRALLEGAFSSITLSQSGARYAGRCAKVLHAARFGRAAGGIVTATRDSGLSASRWPAHTSGASTAFPRKLTRAQCHRRNGHVRPEHVIENQDDELRVLELQVCCVLPERLQIGDRSFRLARP